MADVHGAMSFLRSSISRLYDAVIARIPQRTRPKLLASKHQDINAVGTTVLALRLAVIIGKALLVLALVSAMLFAGTIAIILGTIISAPLINDERLIVQRSSWPIGDAPVGEVVVGHKEGRPNGFFERLEQEFQSEPGERYVAAVIAQPGSRIKADTGRAVIVDDRATMFTSDKTIVSTLLIEEYLVICVDGGCGAPGTPFTIPVDELIGSVQGTLDGFSINRYEIPGV